MISFVLKIPLREPYCGMRTWFSVKPIIRINIEDVLFEFIAWGDPIISSDFLERFKKNHSPEFILHNLYGHYYYILLDKSKNELIIGNSLFSILPIYYLSFNSSLFISNDPFSASPPEFPRVYNKRFLLENILFNYPLFNQSSISGINLLASNHYIKLSGRNFEIKKHTVIEEYFSSSPAKWRNSTDELSNRFIQSIKKYLPKEPYCTALTGGFDGRTLTACSKFYEKSFSTYCFGSSSSIDVSIAKHLSELAGIHFYNIRLDDEYIQQFSYQDGLNFIFGSYGTASFARAHYLYSAKLLSEDFQYMITGNFGSEVLRAANSIGPMISPNLYNIINSANYDKALKILESSIELKLLNKLSFIDEFESLKEDLKSFLSFDTKIRKISKNQYFYKIVFEEVFRKYFGAEMMNQYHYIANRTPFLDIDFLKALLETELAGVHSEYFSNNPFLRFKGQLLYSHIIEKTFSPFGKQILDKGYRPSDMLSTLGKIRIAESFMKKKILKKIRDEKIDSYSVNKAFLANIDLWKFFEPNCNLFNVNFIKTQIEDNNNQDSLFIALSQAWFHNVRF